MSDDQPPTKRLKLSDQQLENLQKEELIRRCKDQEAMLDALESKLDGNLVAEIAQLRESEEKLKQQHIEASRRENVLVMRLTTKEQEMQEYLNQIQELKQAQNNSTAQLRSMLLDPAVNILFQRMCKELEEKKQKLEQTQNDLSAWKFTPDSQTGKRLMAKCRMLLQENDELGKVTSSGRMAKLEGDIALEKTLVQEMKKGQAEMDEFLGELDEDVEGMQSTIYILQQQLKEAREEANKLQAETEQLRQTQTSAMPCRPLNTDTAMAGEISHSANRTSTPNTSNVNLPATVSIKQELMEMQVQNDYLGTSREKFNPPTNGKKSSLGALDFDSTEDTDMQHAESDDYYKAGIQSYQTSKNKNFHLGQKDYHTSTKKTNDNDNAIKTPLSTGSPSSDCWSPEPCKMEGVESSLALDKEGVLGESRTGASDSDTSVPINGLETSPSNNARLET